MALIDVEKIRNQFNSFSSLPALRQIFVMFGLAASVAIGTAIVLWAEQPNFSLLYAGLTPKDAGQVEQALQQDSIPYRISASSGNVLVPQGDLYQARIKLAGDGLPHGKGSAFDSITKSQGIFGFSQFAQQIQYHQALQLELERTIASINAIQSDRVQLAIPKQSVFIENSPQPTASVLVNMYPGRTLDQAQIAGIVHLVASAVPGLHSAHVNIVDQNGNLLTNQPSQNASGSGLSSAQYALMQHLDHLYKRRIERILAPVVGRNGVRAQVTTDLDYSIINTTSESYNPKSQVIRSQQTSQNLEWQKTKGGVPGSLTNQPPPAGVPASKSASNAATASGGKSSLSPGTKQIPLVSESKSATKNYEIDKTIQHIEKAPGAIKRLSVAVVVNYQKVKGKKGSTLKPLSKQQLANIKQLVKEAVGFNPSRGDTISVINAPFQATPVQHTVSGPPIWQRPWVMQLLKWILAGIGLLILMLGVLRPILKGLAAMPQLEGGRLAAGGHDASDGSNNEYAHSLGEEQVNLGSDQRLVASQDYEKRLDNARTMAQEDPKRVAQVMKNWIGDNA